MITRGRLISALTVACLGLGALAGSAAAAPAPAWAPIAGTGPTVLPQKESETQKIGVRAEGGTFTLTFNGQTTSALPFNAAEGEVQAALNALSTVGGAGGSVIVRGGPGGPAGLDSPYVVEFAGSLADANQPQITGVSSALTGASPSVTVSTFVQGGPGTAVMASFIQNIGGADSSGPVTFTGTLPDGVLLNGPATEVDPGWSCSNAPDAKSFTCTDTNSVPAGIANRTPAHPLIAEPGASGLVFVHITASGGGAEVPGTFDMPLTIGETPAGPGFQSFTAGAYDEQGHRDTRAGGHPFSATSGIIVNTVRSPLGKLVPAGELKDIKVAIPPGFLGNPIATPACPAETSDRLFFGELTKCPLDTIVGIAQPGNQFGNFFLFSEEPVVNMEAPVGYPAEFKFTFAGEVIHVLGQLRSDEDFGLDVESANTPQIIPVYFVFFTLWGTPANPIHDAQRCSTKTISPPSICGPSDTPETAFLTNPTNCVEEAVTQPLTTLTTNTWEHPDLYSSQNVLLPPVTGCDKLHFAADFAFEPSDTKADSPASFRTSLTVPSEGLTDPEKLTTPEIRTSVVRLPEGVVLNASGADGLQACSEAQIGLKNNIDPVTGLPEPEPMPNPLRFDKNPNTCPETAKIGTGELKTALLTDPLHGALYLAAQGEGNPFGSLFALYLVIEDPRHGIFIKLPGRVDPDPVTGQMTVTFENLPQLPFTRLDLSLKGGYRSALASPTTCGNYVTTATNTPWSAPESGPPTVSEDSFEIDQGANGRPCASSESQLPLDLGFSAGTTDPLAGAHSPFTMNLTRPDGAQLLQGFELTTPEGFSATLRGIPYCSDAQLATAAANGGRAEQASPSCPAASQIGTTQVGAGAGPTPYYAGGNVYLAGPYKGSKLSLAAIVPAVAGPFDLGTEVVRVALHVNPRTAQLTAITDPLPQIIDGVPLRIRDIRVNIDRPGFALNPTDCSVQAVSARVTGTAGGVTNLSRRFQVGGCANLGFKPKLHLSLKGGTRRGAFPSLRAVLRPRESDANFARAAVTLPHSAFLEQGHIRTICTRVQFAVNACPAASIYGYARAITPLLDDPLEGPVYLRSSEHKLPDLVAKLSGQVDIELDGRIDSVNGRIRNTFDIIPDAPVSKFVLTMQGGRKGLVVNSTNLCRKVKRATVKLTAQNGRKDKLSPTVVPTGCAKHRKHHHKRGGAKSRSGK